jgi:hypothetical protein
MSCRHVGLVTAIELAISVVAVEKLAYEKVSKIMPRQNALQAICRKRLTIYDPQKSCPFYEYRVFQQPQSESLIEREFGIFQMI